MNFAAIVLGMGLAAVAFVLINKKLGELKTMANAQEKRLNQALQGLKEEVANVGTRIISRLDEIKADNPDLEDEISEVQGITAELQSLANTTAEGGGEGVESPTEEPTGEPTEEPTGEPTEEPTEQ